MFVMAAKEELIGHTGDVIADDDVARFRLCVFLVGTWHRAGRTEVIVKKFFQAAYGMVAVLGDGGMIVDVSKEEALERAIARGCSVAEAGQALWGPANVVHGRSAGGVHALLGGFDQVGGQRIEDVPQDFVEL